MKINPYFNIPECVEESDPGKRNASIPDSVLQAGRLRRRIEEIQDEARMVKEILNDLWGKSHEKSAR